MEVKYSIQYNDGYDITCRQMAEDISFLWFKGKDDLIEYINCMCIAMNGNSFKLHDKFPFEIVCYKSNFFNTKLIPSNNSKVVSGENLGYPDCYKWQNWPQYLSEINNMPDGISVSTTPEVMGDFEYSYRGIGQKHTRHMNIEFRISKEYSQRVNSVRARYSKHQDVLEALLECIPFHIARAEQTSTDLAVGRHGIRFGGLWYTSSSTTYFSEFRLKSLANKFECFVFANVLLDYIIQKKKKSLVFHAISIRLDRHEGIRNISNESAYVHLDIWFSAKCDNVHLNRW